MSLLPYLRRFLPSLRAQTGPIIFSLHRRLDWLVQRSHHSLPGICRQDASSRSMALGVTSAGSRENESMEGERISSPTLYETWVPWERAQSAVDHSAYAT